MAILYSYNYKYNLKKLTMHTLASPPLRHIQVHVWWIIGAKNCFLDVKIS